MSLVDTISEEERQHLWFSFTKALIDKRILFYGVKVEKYEVFATFLKKSNNIGDFIVLSSYLNIGKLPNYKLVWKWELFGYKDAVR
jgi:hypothetical protein